MKRTVSKESGLHYPLRPHHLGLPGTRSGWETPQTDARYKASDRAGEVNGNLSMETLLMDIPSAESRKVTFCGSNASLGTRRSSSSSGISALHRLPRLGAQNNTSGPFADGVAASRAQKTASGIVARLPRHFSFKVRAWKQREGKGRAGWLIESDSLLFLIAGLAFGCVDCSGKRRKC